MKITIYGWSIRLKGVDVDAWIAEHSDHHKWSGKQVESSS